MLYYSVDRRGVYESGKLVTLEPNGWVNEGQFRSHISDMYPLGFSRHGAQYYRDSFGRFVDDAMDKNYRSALIELLLENIRKAHYPDKPSRYRSMFATDSLESASEFRNGYGKRSDAIHILEPGGKVHRGDMSLIKLGGPVAMVDCAFHLYWQGRTLSISGRQPTWEYLLELPVRVGARVL